MNQRGIIDTILENELLICFCYRIFREMYTAIYFTKHNDYKEGSSTPYIPVLS